jgi:mannose/fructose/N-acetylgalactosamine-specific phosphotransferase system component IIC
MLTFGFLLPIAVGALLNLDKQVMGPFMVGRPLMTGFVIGWLTGEPGYGVWMGLSAELLWLAAMPLGGQLTPNAGLAVTAALIAWTGSTFTPAGEAFALAVGVHHTEAGLVISFLTVPLWARAFMLIDTVSRRLAPAQLEAARADLAEGRDPRFFRRNLRGLWITLGLSLAALLLAVPVNSLLLHLVADRLGPPDMVTLNLGVLFLAIPFLGLLGMAVFLEGQARLFYVCGIAVSVMTLAAVPWPAP